MVKQKECDCIVAFHIGHSYVNRSGSNKERIIETCCGGVILLKFCPECGKEIKEINKYKKWKKTFRIKDVKYRIKAMEEDKPLSKFLRRVLKDYKKELKQLTLKSKKTRVSK